MSQELLIGLIAAGSAIVASIGAQLIGAVVSRRTDERRLKAEADRYEREAELRKSERFSDEKRTAFVTYLRLRRTYADIYWRGFGPDQLTPEEEREDAERLGELRHQLAGLEGEIGLVAPDVLEEIEHAKDSTGPHWELEQILVAAVVRLRGDRSELSGLSVGVGRSLGHTRRT